jgi:hypothetical protein
MFICNATLDTLLEVLDFKLAHERSDEVSIIDQSHIVDECWLKHKFITVQEAAVTMHLSIFPLPDIGVPALRVTSFFRPNVKTAAALHTIYKVSPILTTIVVHHMAISGLFV